MISFLDYVEGIYMGYKFYETAAEEGLIDFESTVQFPFGYGLSYTSFEQKITELKRDDTSVNVTVEVKNTGSVAGKDVVELYYIPPYTNGGIEKAVAEPEAEEYKLSKDDTKAIQAVSVVKYKPEKHDDPNDVMPTTGAKNGLSLSDLAGKSYDDPDWDKLLDQLSIADMVNLINVGGWASTGTTTWTRQSPPRSTRRKSCPCSRRARQRRKVPGIVRFRGFFILQPFCHEDEPRTAPYFGGIIAFLPGWRGDFGHHFQLTLPICSDKLAPNKSILHDLPLNHAGKDLFRMTIASLGLIILLSAIPVLLPLDGTGARNHARKL